ncbi:hypothetical protein [Bacillus smithii]|uniref:hypothetical protein n=1 Tax=Bacillus smithii TaxID=1479 RepID=UPI003D1EAF38
MYNTFLKLENLKSERKVVEKADIYFVEVTGGVYEVIKDRIGYIGHGKFVDSKIVANTLNNFKKVIVSRIDGCVYVSNSNI